MPRQKKHSDRMYQGIGEPGPGAIAVGYVCHGSGLQVPISSEIQKQCITEFAKKKGWKIAHWYEELGQNAVYEDVEQRPVLTQLLCDAESQFQVVLCAASPYWARRGDVAYALLYHLQLLQVWWTTADGSWNTKKVWEEGMDVVYAIRILSKRTLRRSTSQKKRKGEN